MKGISTLVAITLAYGVSAFAPQNNRVLGSVHTFLKSPVQRSSINKHDFVKANSRTLTEMNMELVEAWNAYNLALESDPLVTKSVTAGVILGAADFTGQLLEKSQNSEDTDIDIARTARFAFFGLVLQAPWNHFYYMLLDGAIPPTEDPFTAVTFEKVIIDQFIQAPIFTVLIFAFLGFLEGKNADAIKEQLDDDYTDTMLANWKLWLPATFVNIGFCPPILRVLFLNVVFFFWSIYLSLKLNSKGEEIEV